jgi:class 3 adenylate cyclase
VRGADIGGIAVHIGARVRDLVIGSGQEFTDHGAHQLKGVPGDWRLFTVAS